MENHGILTHPAGRSFLGRVPVLKLILLWCAIVGACTGYGYYSAGAEIQGTSFMTHAAIESGILWAGLAVGIATCLTSGLFILSRVHIKRLRKGWAVLWLAISSVISAMATLLVIQLVAESMPRDWYILTGERHMARIFIWGWMIMIAAGAFLLFTGVMIFIRRTPDTSKSAITPNEQ